MKSDTLCKTIHQYNKNPISKNDMEKLLDVAKDYQAVKTYVYQRYSGIKSLNKIYPGYTVQKEMGKIGLREKLQLPSVYFNVAILDALGDIKSQWSKTKTAVLKRVNAHSDFSETEKHYLRFLLKVSNAFILVLNEQPISLESAIQKKYEELAEQVNTKKLNHYLCRQVRKYHTQVSAKKADGFSLTERAYRYRDHGIYITIKEKRKRVFVELTDNNHYVRQIFIKLFPSENRLEILVPVQIQCKVHEDYVNEIGLSVGMYHMLTTHEGHKYGEQLGQYQIELAQWVRQKNTTYAYTKAINSGRKKYTSAKKRMTEQLHSYINQELNRFLREEKPKIIYLPKLPPPKKHNGNKAINHSVSMWQRGYIRKRLEQKCQEHSVNMIEVFGKDISNVCSVCGVKGKKEKELFFCPNCNSCIDAKVNAARNAKLRGENIFI